ncbi:hypothetical protein N7507_010398 [Penicillium longicatenatum]|nr:hypothetical protein N7507_010398 [Penicillium longicatenatum]
MLQAEPTTNQASMTREKVAGIGTPYADIGMDVLEIPEMVHEFDTSFCDPSMSYSINWPPHDYFGGRPDNQTQASSICPQFIQSAPSEPYLPEMAWQHMIHMNQINPSLWDPPLLGTDTGGTCSIFKSAASRLDNPH